MNDDFKHNIDEAKVWSIRTDLAYDDATRYSSDNIPDFIQTEEEIDGITIFKNVIGPIASKITNKQVGTYYTIDLSKTDFHDAIICERIEHAVANIILRFISVRGLTKKKCLLVGLGNVNVTPDALGPYVMDNVIVTRHLAQMGSLNSGFSEVSAISPGVMGTTGIETSDIIKAVKDKINVDFLIVVDALASSSIARVNKTIQITDTGIRPGSGVGNKRKELSLATMGVPVIAVGVPTVVDAVTITSDAIDYVIKYLNENAKNNTNIDLEEAKEPTDDAKEMFMGQIGLLDEVEKKRLIQEVLTPNGYNMMVTPKEVDADIEDLSKIIATGLGLALHHGLLTGNTE